MQLLEYRRQNEMTLQEVADGIGAPNRGMVHKHEKGLKIPSDHYKQAYARFTAGAVTFDDWMALRTARDAGKPLFDKGLAGYD